MSTFVCEHCGALCLDSPSGYISGCRHYPPDRAPSAAEWREIDRAWLDGCLIVLPPPRESGGSRE